MIQGVDISANQGNINWDKMSSQGVQYVWMRGAVGKVKDLKLPTYYQDAKNAGYPIGIYYVIKPISTTNWKEQYVIAAELELTYNPSLPIAIDCELSGNLGKQALGDWIYKFLKALEDETKRSSVIYTRAYWWNAHVVRNDWAKDHLLWTAHYTSAPTPLIPNDWGAIHNPKTWTLWQYSADGNQLGDEYGCDGDDSIDLDRFNGGPVEFKQVFGVAPRDLGSVPPPQPSGWVTTTTTLNPRTKPGTEAGTDAGTISPGFTFRVTGPDVNGYTPVETWLWDQGLKDA